MTYEQAMSNAAEEDRKHKMGLAILGLLGGLKFKMLTGARNFAANSAGLLMDLSGTMVKDRANRVLITLDGDTYKIEAIFDYGVTTKTVRAEEGVPGDKLKEAFTRITGLRTP